MLASAFAETLPVPDYYDKKIVDIWNKSLISTLPMERYNSVVQKFNGFPGGKEALVKADGAPAVDTLMRDRLMTVLAHLPNGNDTARTKAQSITIGQFRNMTASQQLAFINSLWDLIAPAYGFDTPHASMFAPGSGGNPPDPLPSSWCPRGKQSGMLSKLDYGMRLAHSGTTDPFLHFGVAFRVDGGDAGALSRITSNGMTQQNQSSWFMRNVRGMVVEGTVAADGNHARFWTGNVDIFNETAVCVSRNFFGGTAFPLRTTYHNYVNNRGQVSETAYALLWAVDVSGLTGFDTEAKQLSIARTKVWRPGEKAFQKIPPERLIGYVKIRKMGQPGKGGWTFDIEPDARWNWLGAGSRAQREYCEGELNAWRGCHYIPGAWDFAA
jgi:hypothetical protein